MKAPLAHRSMKPEMSLPHLPLEIKTLIARHLLKSDLKNLRQADQQWRTAATPFLFDRIFISPRNKDLEVFANITKDPALNNAIKEIIFDATHAPDLSFEGYFRKLCDELRQSAFGRIQSFPFYSGSRQANRFLSELSADATTDSALMSTYRNTRLITEGYQAWQRLRVEEMSNADDEFRGPYYSILCVGLQQLPQLRSVKIDGDMFLKMDEQWTDFSNDPSQPNQYRCIVESGSPLSRSWNPLHLRPIRSGIRLGRYFHHVTQALSDTNKHIIQFHCASITHAGPSSLTFSLHDLSENFSTNMTTALRHLEVLILQITPSSPHTIGNGTEGPLGFLPEFLEQLVGLKRLMLNLAEPQPLSLKRRMGSTPLHNAGLSFSQVFPRLGIWPRLEMCSIEGLAIGGSDLVCLIFVQMPSLKRLWLSRIDLLNCSWEGLIEAMRTQDWVWFLLSFQGFFRHKDREWWPFIPDGDKREAKQCLLQDYMRYVKSGGRHPSLPKEQVDSDSIGYLEHLLGEGHQNLRKRMMEFPEAARIHLSHSQKKILD